VIRAMLPGDRCFIVIDGFSQLKTAFIFAQG